VNFIGGDDFLIYTGFTPEPNADLPNRIGIGLNSNQDILLSSNYNDVIFQSEDASWTVSGSMYLRSSSVGGQFQFISEHEPMIITAKSASFTPTEVIMQATNTLSVTANSISLLAQEDLSITTPSATFSAVSNINIQSNQGDITFLTPRGVVNFQTKGVGDTLQRLQIPSLQYQGGVSQIPIVYPWYVPNPFNNNANHFLEDAKFRIDVENEYPGCEERSFGFDDASETICVCDFNKWRCAETWAHNYATTLYLDYYVLTIYSLALSSPLF